MGGNTDRSSSKDSDKNKKKENEKTPKKRINRKRKFKGTPFQQLHEKANQPNPKRQKLNNCEGIKFDTQPLYRIIHFTQVFTALSTFLICKKCNGEVEFTESSLKGVGFKLVLTCKSTRCLPRSIPSCPLINEKYESNYKLVFVMRLLGVGIHRINLFCGLMDMCQKFSSTIYYSSLHHIRKSTTTIYKEVLKKAVEEEKSLTAKKYGTRNATRLTVSGNVTCKKRGFFSRYSITSLIGTLSNKVIDLVVKSNSCQSCEDHKTKKGIMGYSNWYASHEEVCTNNRKENVQQMKIDSLGEMFKRSLESHEVKYVSYIGDDDHEEHNAIVELNPYGNDEPVTRKECIGHLCKIMGTRLRNVMKENGSIDGGKEVGKLTDDVIKELTTSYELAIRKNNDSLKNMRSAIWATFHHKSSTDETPQHEFCPKGADSWCKWRCAEAHGTLHKFCHSPSLDDDVLKAIKPIYESMSCPTLLERCLEGFNRHNSKSFNSTVWKIAPKDLNLGLDIVTIASHLSTIIFNEGSFPLLKILNDMGVQLGQQAKIYCEYSNGERIMGVEK